MAWHLGGISYEDYMDFTLLRRVYVNYELNEIIEDTDGEPPPSKMKK